MKLAISNIAWSRSNDREVAKLMRRHGFAGVEVAPTKYWPDPQSVPPAEVTSVRSFWEGEGIAVVAIQSLLFGTSGLALFGEPAPRKAMGDWLEGIIRVGARLGAKALIFGSPRNRVRGGLSDAAADEIAAPFFRRLGEVAASEGTCLCIEANPPQYGCDWITTSAQARAFVESVDSKGFGLHLDAAGMTMAGEDLSAAIGAADGAIRHFHASEPQLGPVAPGGAVEHARAARALGAQNYGNWVSIEMREAEGASLETVIEPALALVAAIYGPALPAL